METVLKDTKHPIPQIINSLGKHWPQPNRELITITDSHAIIKKAVFFSLPEYSTTLPSGVYPGKMWRRKEGDRHYLCWFGELPEEPAKCSINFRPVIYQEMVDLVMPKKKLKGSV